MGYRNRLVPSRSNGYEGFVQRQKGQVKKDEHEYYNSFTIMFNTHHQFGQLNIECRLMAGWWLTYPSEKYEFVNWDDHSQYMEK